MKNPDAIKDDLSRAEREMLHGLLMQGFLYAGSEIPNTLLETLLPGMDEANEILAKLAGRGLFETVEENTYRCLPLGYQIGAALTSADIQSPDAGLRHPVPPGWKWPVDNPENTLWDVDERFLKDTAGLEKDKRLRDELLKVMAAVLLDPRYGKPQTNPRKGQRNARVSRNFRLYWIREGHNVVFLEFGSKEDPRIAPRGK